MANASASIQKPFPSRRWPAALGLHVVLLTDILFVFCASYILIKLTSSYPLGPQLPSVSLVICSQSSRDIRHLGLEGDSDVGYWSPNLATHEHPSTQASSRQDLWHIQCWRQCTACIPGLDKWAAELLALASRLEPQVRLPYGAANLVKPTQLLNGYLTLLMIEESKALSSHYQSGPTKVWSLFPLSSDWKARVLGWVDKISVSLHVSSVSRALLTWHVGLVSFLV